MFKKNRNFSIINFFAYIGTTGTTSVAFSAGRVLFNTSTVEFVSLIVVIGRSDVVGVCA